MALRLRTAHRHVPLDRADDYLAAWSAARKAATATGAHAWIFRGTGHEDRFIELVEWSSDAAFPLDDPALAAALEQLDMFALATHCDDWEEVE